MRKTILLAATALLLTAGAALAEPVTRHLGRQSFGFGTIGQAGALRDLITAIPGQEEYRITYTTDEDVVLFGAHLGRDQLLRLHQRPDNTGTAETWNGHARYRIEQGAAGGSLNDTPEGKSPATMTRF